MAKTTKALAGRGWHAPTGQPRRSPGPRRHRRDVGVRPEAPACGDQRQLPGSETSAARQEFLYALNDALPYEAWVQLRTCTQDEVPAWAERWEIHAPCVLEAARATVAFASQGSDPLDIEVWKDCTCDGDRCRHHYVYRVHFGGGAVTTRNSNASLVVTAAWEPRTVARASATAPCGSARIC